MALKFTYRPGGTGLCPMCKEPISKLAKICPHCRSDLTSNEEWNHPENNSGCPFALILALAIPGALYVIAMAVS